MFGMQMTSPTVNMFINGENFLKLAKKPERYLNFDPFPIIDRCEIEGVKPHPVIGIDDIRLNCLHYQSCSDAIEAWNRRRVRVNFDKLLIIATTWDLNEDTGMIDEILKLQRPHLLFSWDPINDANCVTLDRSIWSRTETGDIEPTLTGYYKRGIYRNFEKIIDIVDFINNSFF